MEVTLLKDGRQRATIGEMDCFSPPVPKNKADFLNGEVGKKRDQKWERTYPTEAAIEQMSEADQSALYEREMDRRENGCWFLNDGDPTYLTGDNYFFLTHFKLPSGEYPEFRDADQKFFWWWRAIEEDVNCVGGVFIGARQRGKTARASSVLLNYASLNPNVWCGITSKKKEDAADVFQLFVVPGWQNMSSLLRPKAPAGDAPKSTLEFTAKARKGASANAPREWALNSKIDFRDSKENSYDSKTLKRKFTDEPMKEQLYNSEERRKIESRMMWRGGKAIAKMLMKSSVDEQEAFNPEIAEKIWTEADPKVLTATGRTVNGMKRLMMPSTEAHIIDDHGRSLIEESRRDIEANAPSETDPVARRSYFRANPRHIEDALSSGGKDTTFNLEALDAARLRIANLDKPEYWMGNLEWVDLNDTSKGVKTSDNNVNGRFKLIMRALPLVQNNVQTYGIHSSDLGEMVRYKPLNNALYAAGCDPYDARSVADLGQASKGAAYMFWKPDLLHEAEKCDANGREKPGYWPSDGFIVEYVNRPPRPKDFYEDMVKLCHLFGCTILPENNKPGIIAHFEDRGYGDFISGKVNIIASQDKKQKQKKKKGAETPGQAATGDTAGQWSERVAEFTHGPLVQDLRRMPFPHQVKDVVALNIKDTKKFDAAVATGWTMLLARRFTRPPAKPIDASLTTLSNYFNV